MGKAGIYDWVEQRQAGLTELTIKARGSDVEACKAAIRKECEPPKAAFNPGQKIWRGKLHSCNNHDCCSHPIQVTFDAGTGLLKIQTMRDDGTGGFQDTLGAPFLIDLALMVERSITPTSPEPPGSSSQVLKY